MATGIFVYLTRITSTVTELQHVNYNTVTPLPDSTSMATTMTTILILTAPTASQIRDFNGVRVSKRHAPSVAETVRIKQFSNISINHEGKGGFPSP
jgi:hypothetical protein